MTAYALFDNVEVTNLDGLNEYAARVREVVELHGGRYLAVGGQVDVMEGERTFTYPVLIEFPDLATAHRWYDAPEYQELKALRQSASRADAIFFETAPSALLGA